MPKRRNRRIDDAECQKRVLLRLVLRLLVAVLLLCIGRMRICVRALLEQHLDTGIDKALFARMLMPTSRQQQRLEGAAAAGCIVAGVVVALAAARRRGARGRGRRQRRQWRRRQ